MPFRKLLILMLLNSNLVFSQIREPDCVFDNSTFLELELDISSVKGKVESKLIAKPFKDLCNGWLIAVESEKLFLIIGKEQKKIQIDPKKIKSFKIFIRGTSNNSLDKIQYLKFIPLNSIEEINIYERDNIGLKINLNTWPNRKQIKEDSLFTFILDGYGIADTTLASELKYFKNLRQLQLPFYVNSELLHFKQLKSALIRNSVYFFANDLVCVGSLSDYNNLTDGILEFHRAEWLPQKQFLFENLSIESNDHLIYRIDSLLKLKKSDKLKASGDVFLLADEIFKWESKDTIARGKMVNGKKVGVWKYTLEERYPYYYNFDSNHGCEAVNFPANGKWEYKYPNGKVGIEGNFKEGKKEGVWKFYDLNEQLSSQKEFSSDQPKGLFIDYEKDKQIRKYYFNQFRYIMEISEKGEKTYYTIPTGNEGIREGYNTGPKGDLYLMKLDSTSHDKVIKQIKKNSPEYKKILQQHFLKYLYAK